MGSKYLINKFVWQLIAIWWFIQGFFCYGHSDMMFATIGGAVMLLAFILFVTRFSVIRSICNVMLVFYMILFFGLSILLLRNYDVRGLSITMICISIINNPVIVYTLKVSTLSDIKRYKIFGNGK